MLLYSYRKLGDYNVFEYEIISKSKIIDLEYIYNSVELNTLK